MPVIISSPYHTNLILQATTCALSAVVTISQPSHRAIISITPCSNPIPRVPPSSFPDPSIGFPSHLTSTSANDGAIITPSRRGPATLFEPLQIVHSAKFPELIPGPLLALVRQLSGQRHPCLRSSFFCDDCSTRTMTFVRSIGHVRKTSTELFAQYHHSFSLSVSFPPVLLQPHLPNPLLGTVMRRATPMTGACLAQVPWAPRPVPF